MENDTARVGRAMSRTVVSHVPPFVFFHFFVPFIFLCTSGHMVYRQYIRGRYVGREPHRFVAAWSSRQLEIYLRFL